MRNLISCGGLAALLSMTAGCTSAIQKLRVEDERIEVRVSDAAHVGS